MRAWKALTLLGGKMAHRPLKLTTMDLNKLLNESESMKQAIADQKKADDLKQHLGISHPGELDKIMSAACSGVVDSAAFTSEKVARQAAETALGISGVMPPDFDTAGEKMRKEFERTAGLDAIASATLPSLADQFQADIEKTAGGIGTTYASLLEGSPTINFQEIQQREQERQQQLRWESTRDSMQHIARQAAESKRRDDAKLDYARRSAEASEAALEAERTRTADAKADAVHAREEARISRRNMRISLWFAAGSLLVAAWPFIKEAFGL